MSELHQQEAEFSQLLRELPVDDCLRPEHGAALCEQVLARFDQARMPEAAIHSWKHTFNSGRQLMRRPIPRLIAAASACLAIAAAWLFVPGHQSTALGFNQFAEALVEAKAARFQMEVTIEGRPKQKVQAYYLAPGKFRQEMSFMGAVSISDDRAGKLVMLNGAAKSAVVMNSTGQPKDAQSQNPFERLRELLSKSRDANENQFETLGKKEINGKQATGFRFDSKSALTTLWGDPATGYPVRIETVWSGSPRTEVLMVDFEINVELKDSLFDLTPPADYKVQSFELDVSKPGEPDLVNAFRLCSEIGGGQFPDTLSMVGYTVFIARHLKSRLANPSDDETRLITKQIGSIGRGFNFALGLPETADAHYAGKGVRQGTVDRAIFWYKPEGSKMYRVIYADFSVRDAEQAPDVSGAERLENASKTSAPTEK